MDLKNKLRLLMAMSALLLIGGALWLRDGSDADQSQRDKLMAQRLALRNGARDSPPQSSEKEIPDGWKTAGAREKKAAQQAISDQLAAFRKDDYQSAAKWQSRGLRENFATIDDFRAAITQGYPQFAHSKSVRYGQSAMTPDGARVQIQVFVTGQDNVEVLALYSMVREDKIYRVEAVLPIQESTPDNAPNGAPRETEPPIVEL